MTAYRHGLLIGKFYPPHLGHHAAIRTAAQRCTQVTVLVMAATAETVPLADRVSWLREEHAGDMRIRIIGIRCDAPMDVTDQRVWATQIAIMRAGLGSEDVDAVFCGDAYGPELARWFGAQHVGLHRDGLNSSAVRRDLAGRWHDLAAPVRAGLTTRVVVVGAESTGTTTVAEELTAHYAARGGSWANTRCVAEYGREHTRLKWDADPTVDINDLSWTTDDFDEVAVEQTRREEYAARTGSPVLICDTDAFATSIWERRYLSPAHRTGQPWTQVPPRAVYLVTDHHDVPWHDDGLREGDLEIRAAMTQWFIEALTEAGHSWVLLTGAPEDRLEIAIRTIDPLLAHRARFGEPLHGPGFEANP